MGVRGEIFSNRVMLPNRTYFFNVKENRMGDIYLNIVESKNRETGGFERQSVVLFADDLQEFLKGFDESLKVLEKAVREKRRGGKTESSKPRGSFQDESREGDNKHEVKRRIVKKRDDPSFDRPERTYSERSRPERTRSDGARPERSRFGSSAEPRRGRSSFSDRPRKDFSGEKPVKSRRPGSSEGRKGRDSFTESGKKPRGRVVVKKRNF